MCPGKASVGPERDFDYRESNSSVEALRDCIMFYNGLAAFAANQVSEHRCGGGL